MTSRFAVKLGLRDRLDAAPEFWIGVLAAAAWCVMLPHALAPSAACHQLSPVSDFFAWLWMVVAMMVPLMATSVRWTADRSLRRRQYRAMAELVLGYLLPWALVGIGVAALLGVQRIHEPWVPAVVFALAGLYSLTPVHRALRLARHEVIPLAPMGWRADWDCLRLGVLQGAPCVGSCFLLMLGCALSGHGLVAMAGGAAIGASELRASRRRRYDVPLGCAALSAWYALAAGLG